MMPLGLLHLVVTLTEEELVKSFCVQVVVMLLVG
jgi:hypothetical protein